MDLGLRYVGNDDFQLQIPTRKQVEWVQTVARLDTDTFDVIEDRSRRFHRATGLEIIRLAGYALEEAAKRDLEVIAEMMLRQGRA